MAAEIIASTILNVLFEKLADEALKKLARSKGIHSELGRLKATLTEIQALLNDASRKEIADEAVKIWLDSFQHVAYDIDDVLDGLATEARHQEMMTTHESSSSISTKVKKLITPACCASLSLSNRLHHKLDIINTKLQQLENRKSDLGLILVKDEKPKTKSNRIQTSLAEASTIIGREEDKEKLLLKLLVDEPREVKFSVVPLVGLGGVGKTTLARLLYNETRVNDHFELKSWVCVSDEFDVFKISETIFRSVTGEDRKFEDLNELQMDLREQLKDKRFLLVFDDVWSESYDEWENLVRPFHSGALGSKIIITTRKESLLRKLGFDRLDHLRSLSHDHAVSLFVEHALGVHTFDLYPGLKPLGEGIVKKCGGLPLALKAMGRLLRTKTNEEEWNDVLNSEIWDLESVDEIVPALRLSYHDLPAYLKQLFAYCSLFPKDFVFDKEKLVLLWMAEGYLKHSPAGSKSPERLGNEYFQLLLSRSFFQQDPNDESLFVMHDLMNDLATFVAGEFFIRFDNQRGMENETLAKYRHMSFIREEYIGYQKFEAFKRAKSLRTFFVVSGARQSRGAFHLSNKILIDLLPGLTLLRVLSLSHSNIKEVEFIGSLKHLRYLNLSHTEIRELPENVGNLINLQTLIVFGCLYLYKLPKSFLRLNNLRHFDAGDTWLIKKMPLGIGGLKNLQTLTKIIIEGNDGFAINELKELKNLHGKTSIKGLEKVTNAVNARDANLLQKKLTELELEWNEVFSGPRNETLEKEVLGELIPHSDKLKSLKIVSYGGSEFPKWVGNPSFRELIHVSLHCCGKCTSLPPLGQLPSLKELLIVGMVEVKVIGLELLGTTGVAFPSLESLSFEDMASLESWSTNSGVVGSVFPCLQKLKIEKCPKLLDVSVEALPSLRFLKIDRCHDNVLRSLVQKASLITKLKLVKISGLTNEAWRGVIEHLGAVEELTIQGCDEIRYLWESEAVASKVLVKLRSLKILWCDSLVSLGEKEEDSFGNNNIITSIKTLEVWSCSSMERCIFPDSIESLKIDHCSSITHVSFTTKTGGQKLKSLEITDGNKLGQSFYTTNMPVVEVVEIIRWPDLKSIINFSSSIHLTKLMIHDCGIIESFPDLQLSNIASLKRLEITNCPGMDASFPRGLWPPKLHTLVIGGLKKPVSEWGPQSFPTSLVELKLVGEQVANFSQLSDLLPSSLPFLHISEFEKLESLSAGLEHLTSLQHLLIHTCPKLKQLPKMLLPSLLRLVISDCPKLKERSTGRGSHYWPLISHIPYIGISSGLLNDDIAELMLRLIIDNPSLIVTPPSNSDSSRTAEEVHRRYSSYVAANDN